MAEQFESQEFNAVQDSPRMEEPTQSQEILTAHGGEGKATSQEDEIELGNPTQTLPVPSPSQDLEQANELSSLSDEVTQEFHNMRQPDICPDLFETGMQMVNDCERDARELQRMHHLFIVKLRSVSLRMDLPLPLKSRRGQYDESGQLLRTVVAELVKSRDISGNLINNIHKLGKIMWDQHQHICGIGDELDRVRQELVEQRRANLESSNNKLEKFIQQVENENKGLANQLKLELELQMEENDSERGGPANSEPANAQKQLWKLLTTQAQHYPWARPTLIQQQKPPQ